VAGDIVAKEATFTPTLRDNGPVTEALVLVDDGDPTEGTTYDACSPLVNAAAVAGKIAFMQRGGPRDCTFEVKLGHAADAGALAAIVFNHSGEFIIMTGTRGAVDIPAVMIGQADGQRLLSALQDGESVDVTLDKNLILTVPETGNVLADFSSRGPNHTVPDILKPDVIAPGVNILAGQTPDVANGIRDEQFQYLSGTSMSTPQVAGIAALIREAHPDWSPAAIKSALVTTGRQDIVKEDGETPADPFDIGGGHVVPNLAIEPGLIYEAGKEDYEAFLCGLGTNSVNNVIDDQTCGQLVEDGYPTAASDLNQPSIAVSTLINTRTVRRRVTNVGAATQYIAEVDAPPGIDIEVNPSVLALGNGETGVFDITLSKRNAELQTWQFGSLSWASPEHVVRSPIAVRPDLFIAALDVIGNGTSGSLGFDIEFGYTGTYSATVEGLAAPLILQGIVAGDSRGTYPQIPLDGELPPTVWRSPANMIVASETDTYMRVALFDENTTGDDDLDLYVYYCPTLIECETPLYSGSFDSNEQVDIRLPKVGNYIIDVHGFDTEGVNTDFDLYVWTVGTTDHLGNPVLTAPAGATDGTKGTVTVSWDGLETHRDGLELKAHLGTVTHDDQNPDAVLPLEITVIEIQHPE
jgi:hypothetical protein